MTSRFGSLNLAAALGVAVLGAAVFGVGTLVSSPAAAAATSARVVVTPATADLAHPTTVTVSGTGFQSIKGGFGGIYVMFGAVAGTWQPSAGGVSGVNYAYVPDAETADNHGYLKFVSFLDGATLSAANGGVIAADGAWRTTLVIPGPVIAVTGRDGETRHIDCRTATCGVITIGAHGVVDPQNETFTPVRFAAVGSASLDSPSAAPPASTIVVGSANPPASASASASVSAAGSANPPASASASALASASASASAASSSSGPGSGLIALIGTSALVIAVGVGAGFWWRHRVTGSGG